MGLKVTETTFTAGGSSSRSASDRKAKRTFIVQYDASTPPASYAAIETADDGDTAIPAIGASLTGDTLRKAASISVKPRDQTGLLFDVEVEYTTGTVEAPAESPLDEPAVFEWDFSASSQPYFWDESDTPKPTLSSAGEPFENLLEREVGEIVVTITKNIEPAAWNPITAASFMYPATAVNSGSMTVDGVSVSAGQARFAGVRCSGIQTANGIQYRTLSVTLKLRSSWDHVIDDRGFHELDGEGGLKEIVKGTPPVKVDKPWPLDGSGAAKANVDDEPAKLTFKPYPAKDFSVWGIA